MTTDPSNPPSTTDLIADLQDAKNEVLSAEYATEQLRSRYSLKDIAAFGDRRDLELAIASAHALNRFFSQISALIKREDEGHE